MITPGLFWGGVLEVDLRQPGHIGRKLLPGQARPAELRKTDEAVFVEQDFASVQGAVNDVTGMHSRQRNGRSLCNRKKAIHRDLADRQRCQCATGGRIDKDDLVAIADIGG